MKAFSILTILIIMSATALRADSIHDIAVKDIDGKDTTLGAYKGKVLLVVNVASKCGLTPQYKALEATHEKCLIVWLLSRWPSSCTLDGWTGGIRL